MTGDYALFFSVALGTVFLIAAIGKARLAVEVETPLVLGELLLAGFLISGQFELLSGVLAWGAGVVYLSYAVLRGKSQRCQCFGQRLPSTSRTGQIVRNLGLLLVATTYLLLAFAGGRRLGVNASGVDVGLGALVGIALVAGPWWAEWIQPQSV